MQTWNAASNCCLVASSSCLMEVMSCRSLEFSACDSSHSLRMLSRIFGGWNSKSDFTESISTITKHPHLRRLDWEYYNRQDNSFPWASQFISPDSQRILMREEQARRVQPSLRHPECSLMRAEGLECWRIPPWQPKHEPEPGSWLLLTLPTTRQY